MKSTLAQIHGNNTFIKGHSSRRYFEVLFEVISLVGISEVDGILVSYAMVKYLLSNVK